MKDIAEKIEGRLGLVAERIGYGRLLVWKDLLFHPDETLEKEMKNASLGRAAKDLFVSAYAFFLAEFLYVGVVFGAIALFFLLLGAGTGMNAIDPVSGIAAIVAGVAIALILGSALASAFGVVGHFAWAGIEFALARMLGGKGEYAQHAYLSALAGSACYVAGIPLMLLALIPCIGQVFSMAAMGLAVYMLYVRYKAIRLVHGIGQKEAIFVTVAPSAVFVILFVALYALVFLSFFAAGLGLG